MSRLVIVIFFLAGVPVIANEMQARDTNYSASLWIGSTHYKNSAWPHATLSVRRKAQTLEPA
jgi:hypothetical protein